MDCTVVCDAPTGCVFNLDLSNRYALPPAAVPEAKYDASNYTWCDHKFVELSVLNATPCFLVDDTVVLTVDITVQREARFALDSGAADGFFYPGLCKSDFGPSFGQLRR
jgi:hypothetical protein